MKFCLMNFLHLVTCLENSQLLVVRQLQHSLKIQNQTGISVTLFLTYLYIVQTIVVAKVKNFKSL